MLMVVTSIAESVEVVLPCVPSTATPVDTVCASLTITARGWATVLGRETTGSSGSFCWWKQPWLPGVWLYHGERAALIGIWVGCGGP